jgi:hypothetical protein
MFLGDSNVEQYYPRIDKLLTDHPAQSKSVLFVTKPGCAPVSNVTGFSETKCAAALIQKGLYLAQRDPGIDTVIIGARWNGYRVFEDAEASDRAFEDVEKLLREFAQLGPQVYLILPIPSNKDLDPARMVKRSLRDFGFKAIPTHVGRGAVEVALHPIVSRLKTAAHSAGAVVIDPVEYLCRRDCPALTDDGAPVYKDNGHLRPSFVRDNVTFLDAIITGDGGF